MAQLEYYRNAVNKLVNSLSWKTQVVAPVAVDATLGVGDVELQALEGKCSPCRAVPVSVDGEAELSVVNVVQSVKDGQLVNEAVVQFAETVKVSFTDDNEFLLRLLPQLSDGAVSGVDVIQQQIEAPLTCDDVP